MKDKIKQLLDNCTTGLVGDSELRLDIQSELKSHIEDRVEEEKANGADEEKSLETAIKAFGEAPEIADSILSSNKKRINLRSKMRIAAMYLILPLSVVSAIFSLDAIQMLRIMDVSRLNGISGGPVDLMGINKKDYSEDEKLILYGDNNTKGPEKYKAICDKFPGNKVYLGNYITQLTAQESDNPIDSEMGKKYISELRRAERVDPDNAYYNYLLAGYYVDSGAEMDYAGKDEAVFKLKDREMLDKGMSELKKGMGKPYLNSYSNDMLKERLKIMGRPETAIEGLQQISVAAGVLLPGLSKYRDLARISPHYAEILIKEKKIDEALIYLSSWKTLGTQINADGFTLIDILVAGAVFEVKKELIPKLYREAGRPELADKYIKEQQILSEPLREWKARRKSLESDLSDKYIREHGGILTAMLLPAIGEKIDKGELAANRNLEYIILETVGLSQISIMMVIIIIACLLVMLRGRFAKQGEGSILLMPTLSSIANLFLYCVIVPIIGYYVISHLPFIGGRDFNIISNSPKWLLQVVCLYLALVVIPIEATIDFVRKRFKALELPMPEKFSSMWKSKFFKISFIILLGLAVLPAFIFHQSKEFGIFAMVIVGFVWIVVILTLICRFFVMIFAKNEYCCYYSSIAKTLIPVVAGSIILLVAISKPYVTTQETFFVQNDPLMTIDYETPSFTVIEGRLVKRLQKEIKEKEMKIKK